MIREPWRNVRFVWDDDIWTKEQIKALASLLLDRGWTEAFPLHAEHN